MIKVYDLMHRGVIFCYPDDTAKQVAEMMVENRIRSIAVVDETGEVWGSVSRLDLLRHYGEDLETIKAQEIMRPYTLEVDPQWPIEQAIELMKKRRIEHLLITESYTVSRRLVGILTNYDIVRFMSAIEPGHYERLLRSRLG